jgi:hypothetical protein
MYRAHRRGNQVAARKYDEYCQRLHKKRIRTIKAAIDNKAPKRPSHLRKNLKREQMMEERYATIERENRLLLEKMSAIMQGGHGIDNRLKKPKNVGTSMNKSYRKKELQRITQENQAILRRIQACEPSLNRAVWEEDRRQNEKWLRNICENPFVLRGQQPGGLGGASSMRRRQQREEYPDDLYETDMGGGGMQGSQSLPRLDPAYQAQSQQRMQNSMSQGDLDYEPRAGSRGNGQRLEPLQEQGRR